MVIGGITTGNTWTNDIELVSLDAEPIPDCLSNLNPFPYGTTIFGAAGAALTAGMVYNNRNDLSMLITLLLS